MKHIKKYWMVLLPLGLAFVPYGPAQLSVFSRVLVWVQGNSPVGGITGLINELDPTTD